MFPQRSGACTLASLLAPTSPHEMLEASMTCNASVKPRPHDRKTASQRTQLAASLTHKRACRIGTSDVGVLSPRQ